MATTRVATRAISFPGTGPWPAQAFSAVRMATGAATTSLADRPPAALTCGSEEAPDEAAPTDAGEDAPDAEEASVAGLPVTDCDPAAAVTVGEPPHPR